jgi:hypothetical protein
VNLKNEVNIETILRELGEFRAEANERLQELEKRGGAVGRDGEPVRVSPNLSGPASGPGSSRPLLVSLTDAARSGSRPKENARQEEAESGTGGGQLAGK